MVKGSIKAKGLRWGKELEVIATQEESTKITVTFNGMQDEWLKKALDLESETAPPMGGTYWPERGTMLAYYNLFQNTAYFDELESLEITGDIGTIPCEPGTIY